MRVEVLAFVATAGEDGVPLYFFCAAGYHDFAERPDVLLGGGTTPLHAVTALAASAENGLRTAIRARQAAYIAEKARWN